MLQFDFECVLIEWRGPAPYVFAPLPKHQAAELREVSGELSYGWGCIAAIVRLGDTTYGTSIFPRDGGYLVPVKVAVQRAESIGVGDRATLRVQVGR